MKDISPSMGGSAPAGLGVRKDFASSAPKAIARLKRRVDTEFSESERTKIQVLEPEALFFFLDSEIAKQASTETRMKGYRVKVEYDAITESEMAKKRESITQSVVKSMKGKKK